MNQAVENLDFVELVDSSEGGELLFTKDIDLVGHVNVAMQVEVGSVNMPISDFFKLKSGSVVKLNESVETPMKLLVDGKVVAVGQLVAAGDNFGLEILDIVS